jgi:hypothetical protein
MYKLLVNRTYGSSTMMIKNGQQCKVSTGIHGILNPFIN